VLSNRDQEHKLIARTGETMTWSRIIATTWLVWLTGCQPPEQAASEPVEEAAAAGISGDLAQASYSMGYIVGSNINDQFGGDLDEEAFVSGLRDQFAGNERQVSEEDSQRALTALVARREEAVQEESTGATDTVSTHYHGTLIDGKVFDSSVNRGEPVSFPLNRVISGWTEALQLMPVGSKWRLFIPPGLGYGSRATGEIPPNSTLIFDVELLGIEAAS
jgi:FKBP-type peptidyl-prolyl cis-trans isomerase FklB